MVTIIVAVIGAFSTILGAILGAVIGRKGTKSSRQQPDNEAERSIGVKRASSADSDKIEHTNILIIGQTCYDNIVPADDKPYDQVGGSTYYVTKAIERMAGELKLQEFLHLDVWAPSADDDYGRKIRPKFKGPCINTEFTPAPNTLNFVNIYLHKTDRSHRKQKVLKMPGERIKAADMPPKFAKKLKEHRYQIVFLLTLTPYDFLSLAEDFVPFLKKQDPNVDIALELQGLTRDIPENGGVVRKKISDDIPSLLNQNVISCTHCTIKEGLDVLRELQQRTSPSTPLSRNLTPSEIASQLCEHGIENVGLTNGGKETCVAWRNNDGVPETMPIPPQDMSSIAKAAYATGAGDTWFGIYAYLLLTKVLTPDRVPGPAAALATFYATYKCLWRGALGE